MRLMPIVIDPLQSVNGRELDGQILARIRIQRQTHQDTETLASGPSSCTAPPKTLRKTLGKWGFT